MKNSYSKTRPFSLIAREYFGYLGKHLPHQCASDEFYFLPRSEAAVQHLSRLDDLTPGKIEDHIRHIRDLLSQLSQEDCDDLEDYIDRLLLAQSMESFIREFDDAEVWRNDPTLYVKIPLFATDHIISQRHISPEQIKPDLLNLFARIPSFLSLATDSLRSPPEIFLQVAVDMIRDALDFYNRDVRSFIEETMGRDRELLAKNKEVLDACERYKKDLLQLSPRGSFAIGEDGLKKILTASLSYHRSPGEILEIARYGYHKTLENIRALAKKIDSNKTWDIIINEQLPSVSSEAGSIHLYEREVQNLRRFFYSQDIITIPCGEKVAVLKTPPYLESLRATASYKAPLTGDAKASGVFYITPGKEDLQMISSHCPYLSAHETYPGHHILDHIRIHHPNPIRRQIESPLFYEGWACYSEQLLDEFGYIHDPRQKLVQLQRQLWRCIRAILDVELQREKMTLAEAEKEIHILGFSSKRARRQIRRFCLTPGYQLCYFMGTYEIIRLREKFSPQIGIKVFHDTLLDGGEIPFHLAEKRLEARFTKKEKTNENN